MYILGCYVLWGCGWMMCIAYDLKDEKKYGFGKFTMISIMNFPIWPLRAAIAANACRIKAGVGVPKDDEDEEEKDDATDTAGDSTDSESD